MNEAISGKKLISDLIRSSSNIERRVIFSDGDDIRLVKALDFLREFNKSRFILIGNEKKITDNIKEAGVKNKDIYNIIDPAKSKKKEEYAEIVINSFKKRDKEITSSQVDEILLNTSYFAAIMLKNNEADCAVGGSISSTEALMKAVINILGLVKGKKYLSGAAFVEVPDCIYGLNGKFVVADPAIIPCPTQEQLLDITLSTYETAKAFLGEIPYVALLSYSTKGSANSEEIDKIRNVVELARQIKPEIIIDGEMQFDAAIVPEVCKIKAQESPLKGKSNVLIFPDLNAANISYKIFQRIGKATICGTVVQGAAKPFNDLSRGCLVEDIVALITMTLLQTKGMEDSNLI
ncbi:MAG: phosphate acyltransferase [Actinobacteria bacterium]|nr:phosphate acyltransferase [Actinomycetota bacterium]